MKYLIQISLLLLCVISVFLLTGANDTASGIRYGPTLPSTCTGHEVFMLVPPGIFYYCNVNTWATFVQTVSGTQKTCDGTTPDTTHAAEGDLWLLPGSGLLDSRLQVCMEFSGSTWGWRTVQTQ